MISHSLQRYNVV